MFRSGIVHLEYSGGLSNGLTIVVESDQAQALTLGHVLVISLLPTNHLARQRIL